MVKTVRNAVREIAREPRQHPSTLLICAVAAFFGAAMIAGTQLLAHLIAGPQGADGAEGGVALMLGLLGTVFFGIAIFVAAIVVVNTFSIVVAGRTRTIALLRLRKPRRRAGAPSPCCACSAPRLPPCAAGSEWRG